MEKKIPTYRIVVNADDEKTGVYAVSLVDEPAIEVDWIKLSKEIVEFEFSVNKDKQMLFGPLLIPGKLIFRRDEKGNEYNIVFDEETIQTIADKYNENKLNDVFNFQHSDKKVEAALLQNWITGEIDKSQEYGFTLPKGTWFGGVKVKDENFWMTEVKTEKVKGFSVEIMAGTELVEMSKVKCTFAKRLSLKSVMAVRECLGCPPNGDGTTTKGEPDRRCGGGGKTKTATPKAPAKAADKSTGPNAGEAYDKKVFDNGEKAPNGLSMYDIKGPEWKNPELRQSNADKGLIPSKEQGVWVNMKVDDYKSGLPTTKENTPFGEGYSMTDKVANTFENARTIAEDNKISHPITPEQEAHILKRAGEMGLTIEDDGKGGKNIVKDYKPSEWNRKNNGFTSVKTSYINISGGKMKPIFSEQRESPKTTEHNVGYRNTTRELFMPLGR